MFMNRANETFRVSEIIFRYILGELADEEKEQLERWLDEKPDHKYLFEDLVKEAKKSEKIKAYGRIDLYEALEEEEENGADEEKASLYNMGDRSGGRYSTFGYCFHATYS